MSFHRRICSPRSAALCLSLGLSLGLAVWLAAPEASAYCRTRTCQLRKNVPCPQDELTGCYTEGEQLYWGDTCLTYAIQRDGSRRDGISAEQLAPIVASGFDAWSDTSCAGGGTPPLTALSQGLIACDGVEFNCEDPAANSNLIVFRDDFVDTLSFHLGVLALTTITANLRTGQIFDADIEINSRDEDFSLDLDSDDERARNLHGVLTHEIGHLLGISHSRELGALMLNNYRGTVYPAEDDAAALCDARGNSNGDPECDVIDLPPDAGCVGTNLNCRSAVTPVPQQSTGCACRIATAPRAPGAHWLLAGLMTLTFARRRRSAAQRRHLGRDQLTSS